MPGRGDMRVFVAIDIDEDARAALERLQDDLPLGRLMDPDTFHLTLAFLGEQPAPVVEAVHDALQEISAAAVSLQLRGVDTFGGGAPKVLWAGIESDPALITLRDKIRRALRVAGVALPRERFRPHVTLARFGRLRGDELEKLRRFLAFHAGFTAAPFVAQEVTLYRSALMAEGAVHEALADYPLG